MSISATKTYYTTTWTPIINNPENPFLSTPIKKDAKNRIIEIETIAFPMTKIRCLDFLPNHMLKVETEEYKFDRPLYVDSRFLIETDDQAPEREKILPSKESIIEWLKSCQGTRYFWGGNCREGISKMLDIYPHLKNVSLEEKQDALCQGLDCSGLLYQATNGLSPRNTSGLVSYGREIDVRNLVLAEIQQLIQPLDLIVFSKKQNLAGHVIIVINSNEVIESRIDSGVVISPFLKRVEELMKIVETRQQSLSYRRWYPE